MPRPSSTIHLGDLAPSFALIDALTGEGWDLDRLLRDGRGALLVFHRGMW
jgi:hypothetical protein